tara:strand:+ start:1644 stop:2624 length:981 start_codon:yes stop_codon:yes gene_type:complete
MNIIEVKNLYKNYGKVEAVKGISFDVLQGEIFGFLGPNGAGKTTTINILCTLLKQSSGETFLDGLDISKNRNDVRKRIGLVFQDTTLDDYLTAEENIKFHAYAYGIPRTIRTNRIETLLKMVGLWDRRKESVRNYSGGMRRRLEIARGLLHLPKVLFLDEPTLGLDPQTRRTIWEHINEIRQKDKITIFMTTHYMDEAEQCNRIAIIDHGKIIALDTPKQLKVALGGDTIQITTDNVTEAIKELKSLNLIPKINANNITFTVPNGNEFLPKFVHEFKQKIISIGLRTPTLDDVFISLTGKAIREENRSSTEQMRTWRQRRGMRGPR